MKKKLKTYWIKSPYPGNFGDILTPIILNFYNFEVIPSSLKNSEYLFVGSVARKANSRHTVLGSGIIRENESGDPNANWIWARGPRTRNSVIFHGGSCPEIFGDPALLLPRIVNPSRKKIKVGIIPHFVDYKIASEKYPNFHIIDILDKDPTRVIKDITSCQYIISSSLHGIITAHAYGIPAAWVKFSNKLKGDDSKFYDHFEAMNLKAEISSVENPIYTSVNYDDYDIHNILVQKEF